MTEWKPVVGYEGLYEVSSDGNVRTVEREYKSGEYYHSQTLPQKVLKPKKDKDGYRSIGLRKNGERKFIRIARIVCVAFHDNPDNKPVVNHINGIKCDDRKDNLEWSTLSENVLHSIYVLGNKKGSPPIMIGKDNPASRQIAQYGLSGKLIRKYDCITDAEKFGFQRPNICKVARGKYKTHGGYKWAYI